MLISSAFTALLNCAEVGRRNRILTNYRFLSHSHLFLSKEETIEKWEKRINREIKGYWNACENNSLSFDTKK